MKIMVIMMHWQKRKKWNVNNVITICPNALKFGVWHIGTWLNKAIQKFYFFSKFEKLRQLMTSFWRTCVTVTSKRMAHFQKALIRWTKWRWFHVFIFIRKEVIAKNVIFTFLVTLNMTFDLEVWKLNQLYSQTLSTCVPNLTQIEAPVFELLCIQNFVDIQTYKQTHK